MENALGMDLPLKGSFTTYKEMKRSLDWFLHA